MKTLFYILVLAFVVYVFFPLSISIRLGSTNTGSQIKVCVIKKSKRPVDIIAEII
jgi:hypothetical protein